jgi:hypothetical protein
MAGLIDQEVLFEQLAKQRGESEVKLVDWGTRQFTLPLTIRANVYRLTIGPTENVMVVEWNGIYGVGKTTSDAVEALKTRVLNTVKYSVGNIE